MFRAICILLICLTSISCSIFKRNSDKSDLEDDINIRSNSTYQITLLSHNLSEDLTKNDELLILGYIQNKDELLESPILNKTITIDSENMEKSFEWDVNESVFKRQMWLFIIEQDSNTPTVQIDAILRIHYNEIISAFDERNYSKIEMFLGDEDLLHIRSLELRIPMKFTFRGVYKMDSYSYDLSIN